MTNVRIKNLNVKLNNRHILKNINFDFSTNEKILILGESGCGKSTLLLSLMGITHRFENAEVTGDVFIGDRSIRDMKPYEISKILGMVFQNPESQFCSLYPKDEVAFGLENHCLAPCLMDDIIDKSFQAVGFPKERYDSAINTLSGGEQQRLAIAAIFAQEAEMLLLDEPTSNLDPFGRSQVVKSSKSTVNNGRGIIIVEHNLEQWLPFLNRLIILKSDGTILCDGSSREVFKIYGARLAEMGIWRPKAVRLYEELKKSGFELSRLPLNFSELIDENIPNNILSSAFKKMEPYKKIDNLCDTTILEVKDLSVQYEKDKPVFSNIELNITEGDFFALVGCNGSGKSTLAKALINIIKPSCGEIRLYGQSTMEMKLKDISGIIAYVFQNPEHQFIEDTVWSELFYSVDQLNIDEKSKKDYVRSLLREFELESLTGSNPFSLSGGQKRRLSVATMLVGNQKLLILDEPTFGQDEKNAYKLMDKLSELNNRGITIFMITHDLDLVEEYANKVAVMHKGSITFCGKTSELWEQKSIIRASGLDIPFKIRVMSGDDATYA